MPRTRANLQAIRPPWRARGVAVPAARANGPSLAAGSDGPQPAAGSNGPLPAVGSNGPLPAAGSNSPPLEAGSNSPPLAAGSNSRPLAAGSNITQHIVDAITAAIVERRLVPGTQLAEQPIADLFQVSRTLVRQALNRLSRDRLVTLRPSRGAFVAEPGAEEARQVFEVRRMLEAALVKDLCATITDAQVAVLRAHLHTEAAAVNSADVAGRTRLLAGFHVLLAQLRGNAVLADLLADLLNRSALAALTLQTPPSAGQSQASHAAIVEAIARGDARAATRLLCAHLHHVEHDLQPA